MQSIDGLFRNSSFQSHTKYLHCKINHQDDQELKFLENHCINNTLPTAILMDISTWSVLHTPGKKALFSLNTARHRIFHAYTNIDMPSMY